MSLEGTVSSPLRTRDETSASTVDCLEEGLYLLQHKSGNNINEIFQHIDNFALWLNSTLISCILKLDNAERKKCFTKLTQLRTSLKKIKNITTVRREKYTFVCNICSEQVIINPDKKAVWATVQEHEHFEMLLAERLSCKSDSTGDILKDFRVPSENLTQDEMQYLAKNELQNVADEEELPPFNFKFNFKLHYDDRVKEILYPEEMVELVKATDQIADCTVQNHCLRYYCLICDLPVMNLEDLRSHLNRKDHPEDHPYKLSDFELLNILHLYHSEWLKMPPVYQAHQIFFIPAGMSLMRCKICHCNLKYALLEQHIGNDAHRQQVLYVIAKTSTANEKLCELLNIQMQVYANRTSEEFSGECSLNDVVDTFNWTCHWTWTVCKMVFYFAFIIILRKYLKLFHVEWIIKGAPIQRFPTHVDLLCYSYVKGIAQRKCKDFESLILCFQTITPDDI